MSPECSPAKEQCADAFASAQTPHTHNPKPVYSPVSVKKRSDVYDPRPRLGWVFLTCICHANIIETGTARYMQLELDHLQLSPL